jgi:hypothetical protein
MVAAGRHRLLQLPRGADKHFDTDRVLIPRHQSLAAHATAAEPERLDDLGADQAVDRALQARSAMSFIVGNEITLVGMFAQNGFQTIQEGAPNALGGATAFPAVISIPDEMSRESLRLGMSGSVTAFSGEAGVIGLPILVWISSYTAYL